MQSVRKRLAVLLLYAQPNLLAQIAPPSLGGVVLALRVLICFPALTLVGDEGAAGENNFIGHGLCIRKAGTGTWLQIRGGSVAGGVAAFTSLLPRHRGDLGKKNKTKTFSSLTTYFHSWMVRVAGQLHLDCAQEIYK